MRNEKISLELFAIISKKYSFVEIDGHGEGENVACEKRGVWLIFLLVNLFFHWAGS